MESSGEVKRPIWQLSGLVAQRSAARTNAAERYERGLLAISEGSFLEALGCVPKA
jgi:hypothetical protein